MSGIQFKSSGLPTVHAPDVLGPMPVTPPHVAPTAGASAFVAPVPVGTVLGRVPGLEGLPPETDFHDKYEILDRIGGGGQAVVMRVRARDGSGVVVDRRVRLDGDFEAQQRIVRDIRVTSQLHHPGIVRTIECFDASEIVTNPNGVRVVVEPRFHLVQEEVPGTNLNAHLTPKTRLSAADVVAIRDQLVDALEYAHAQGIIHRDVKPSNVMVSRDADGAVRVTLIDFGIAKIAGDQTGSASHAHFTWNYAAPELIGGVPGAKVSAATDWYSLGLTLLSLLEAQPNTNLVIFENPLPRAKALRKKATDPVAKALLKDIERMLAWKPSKRVMRRSTPSQSRFTFTLPWRRTPAAPRPAKVKSAALQPLTDETLMNVRRALAASGEEIVSETSTTSPVTFQTVGDKLNTLFMRLIGGYEKGHRDVHVAEVPATRIMVRKPDGTQEDRTISDPENAQKTLEGMSRRRWLTGGLAVAAVGGVWGTFKYIDHYNQQTREEAAALARQIRQHIKDGAGAEAERLYLQLEELAFRKTRHNRRLQSETIRDLQRLCFTIWDELLEAGIVQRQYSDSPL